MKMPVTKVVLGIWWIGMSALANAAVVPMSGEPSQTTPNPFYFTPVSTAQALAMTLNDPFAYDPLNPTNPLPDQVFDGTGSDGYHGFNGTSVTLAYTFDQQYQDLFFDLYGRDATGNPTLAVRDNNLVLTLYSNSWNVGDVVYTSAAFDISDTTPFYARFAAPPNVIADRATIFGPDQSFALMEIRANGTAVPEPSVVALLGVGACLFRGGRRRTGVIE